MSDDTYIIATRCPNCSKVSELEVPADGYNRWRRGEYIQVALSGLTAGQREQLMTGYDEKCWDDLFGEGGGEW